MFSEVYLFQITWELLKYQLYAMCKDGSFWTRGKLSTKNTFTKKYYVPWNKNG